MTPEVRRARPSDAQGILRLLQPYVQRGELLPRSLSEVSRTIDTWVVAQEGDTILGCGSLVAYTSELSEVRSLAVAADRRGEGIGQAVMDGLVDVARGQDVRRLFALTLAVPFFLKAGFERIDMREIPEKVWRDCAPCPLWDRCDEHPVILVLSKTPAGRAPVTVGLSGGNSHA